MKVRCSQQNINFCVKKVTGCVPIKAGIFITSQHCAEMFSDCFVVVNQRIDQPQGKQGRQDSVCRNFEKLYCRRVPLWGFPAKYEMSSTCERV